MRDNIIFNDGIRMIKSDTQGSIIPDLIEIYGRCGMRYGKAHCAVFNDCMLDRAIGIRVRSQDKGTPITGRRSSAASVHLYIIKIKAIIIGKHIAIKIKPDPYCRIPAKFA